ncbi:unnamed protein product [Caretta caretta]
MVTRLPQRLWREAEQGAPGTSRPQEGGRIESGLLVLPGEAETPKQDEVWGSQNCLPPGGDAALQPDQLSGKSDKNGVMADEAELKPSVYNSYCIFVQDPGLGKQGEGITFSPQIQ